MYAIQCFSTSLVNIDSEIESWRYKVTPYTFRYVWPTIKYLASSFYRKFRNVCANDWAKHFKSVSSSDHVRWTRHTRTLIRNSIFNTFPRLDLIVRMIFYMSHVTHLYNTIESFTRNFQLEILLLSNLISAQCKHLFCLLLWFS